MICVIVFIINIFGMIGCCGKCFGKKLSLMVTFFTSMAYDLISIFITWFMSRNGYWCGSKFMMVLMFMVVGRFFFMFLVEELGFGVFVVVVMAM